MSKKQGPLPPSLSLREWIESVGRSQVSGLLGVHRTAVDHWCRGFILPTHDKMRRIVHFSKGRVSYERMIEDYHSKKNETHRRKTKEK